MTKEKLGPTGKVPEGKLNADDEGELRLGVGADPVRKKVVIEFGKPIQWLALNPDQAREFGQAFIQKANEIDGLSNLRALGADDIE